MLSNVSCRNVVRKLKRFLDEVLCLGSVLAIDSYYFAGMIYSHFAVPSEPRSLPTGKM